MIMIQSMLRVDGNCNLFQTGIVSEFVALLILYLFGGELKGNSAHFVLVSLDLN